MLLVKEITTRNNYTMNTFVVMCGVVFGGVGALAEVNQKDQ